MPHARIAERGVVVAAVETKYAALKALLRAAADGDTGPLHLDGQEQRFERLVLEGRGANEIAIELDLPIDDVIAGLWRLAG